MRFGSRAALVTTAVFSALSSGTAQSHSGRGFLFHAPDAAIVLRGGYTLANTAGDPYGDIKTQTTVGNRSFDAATLGADLDVFVAKRLDAVISLDLSTRTKNAEYRDWEENGNPITQQTTVNRAGLSAGLRYDLASRGRAISALAWIPSASVPYVGIGGGVMWYDLVQKGDFVTPTSTTTANIYSDKLQSSSQDFMGVAYAGLEHRLGAHLSLQGEARYTYASAPLVGDFAGLGDIQLSGLALTLGTSIRF
jgi:hypothetical protein